MGSLCSVDISCVFVFCFTFTYGLMRRVTNEKSFEMCIKKLQSGHAEVIIVIMLHYLWRPISQESGALTKT